MYDASGKKKKKKNVMALLVRCFDLVLFQQKFSSIQGNELCFNFCIVSWPPLHQSLWASLGPPSRAQQCKMRTQGGKASRSMRVATRASTTDLNQGVRHKLKQMKKIAAKNSSGNIYHRN